MRLSHRVGDMFVGTNKSLYWGKGEWRDFTIKLVCLVHYLCHSSGSGLIYGLINKAIDLLRLVIKDNFGRTPQNLDHNWIGIRYITFVCPEKIDHRDASGFAYAFAAGILSSTSVPESTSLHISRLPPINLARSRMPRKPQ
jgi:hypothetical protein